MKRGQVTVFIVVGVLALVMLFFIISLTSQSSRRDISQEEDLLFAQPVQQFAQNCIEKTLHDAIFMVSSQGGFYKTPAPFIEYSYFQIPYYFDNATLINPSESLVVPQIDQYLSVNLPICLGNVSFPGLIITLQVPVSMINIEQNQVVVDLHWPIEVQKENSIKIISDFIVTQPVELGSALLLSQQIIQEQEKYPDSVRMSRLTNISADNNLFIRLYDLNNTVIYALDYPNSTFSPEYVFTFAVKYPW